MDQDFWLEKWRSNQIGFHEDVVHPVLEKYWPSLRLGPAPRIFVPLCGKSKDMLWLRERGCEIVGVELSEIAVSDFFRDNNVEIMEERTVEGLRAYRGDGVTLWCGDFFELTGEHLGTCTAFYDRAALIALSPEVRRKYAAHLRALLPRSVQGLLITVDYNAEDISPPPFVVPDEEVFELFGDWCPPQLLGRHDAAVKGLPAKESAFHLASPR